MTRNLLFVAVSMLSATPALALDNAWKDENCLFRSSVIQKGGENSRTSIYTSDSAPKSQYCSPTASNDLRPANSNDRNYYESHVRNAPLIRPDGTYIYQEVAPATGY